ncbi:MAG TPA: hypothetical protein PL124_03910 [Candidatus Cloacimonadota bacterium]|nr:hypothetical protein [Candidatus Cloacimonadota bacterium]
MAEQIQYTPKHWSWTNPMSPLEDAFKLFIEDKRQKQQLSIQSRANELKAVETGLMSVAINSTLNADNLRSMQYKNDLDADKVESEITKLTNIKDDQVLSDIREKTLSALESGSPIKINGVDFKVNNPVDFKKFAYDIDENDPLTVKYWIKGSENDKDAWFMSTKIDANGKYISKKNTDRYDAQFFSSIPVDEYKALTIKAPLVLTDSITKKITSLTEKKKQIETAGNTNIANTARISNEAMDLWLETLRKQINGGWQ